MVTTTKALRIAIPGGTGQLGQILTRNPSGPTQDWVPWRTLAWDGETLGEWSSALEGADVLINLAGRSVNCRYKSRNRREILDSRVLSTQVLAKAIRGLAHPPKVWLNASTATIYRHSFDRAMDEVSGEIGEREAQAPASWKFSIDVATQWEASFFGAAPRTRKVAPRGGMVMSPDASGIFGQSLRLVRVCLGGAAGNRKQYMSWIHDQDFARAVDYLIEPEEMEGVVNVTAPAPLPNRDFMRAIREAWGIGFALPEYEWMLGGATLVQRSESEWLLKSRRVIPGRLGAHGFPLGFPTWPEAARDLVRRVREAVVKAKSKEQIQKSLEEARERTT